MKVYPVEYVQRCSQHGSDSTLGIVVSSVDRAKEWILEQGDKWGKTDGHTTFFCVYAEEVDTENVYVADDQELYHFYVKDGAVVDYFAEDTDEQPVTG